MSVSGVKLYKRIELTGENGILHGSVDGADWLRARKNDESKQAGLKRTINQEAKNYIIRVESEVRKKFAHHA